MIDPEVNKGSEAGPQCVSYKALGDDDSYFQDAPTLGRARGAADVLVIFHLPPTLEMQSWPVSVPWLTNLSDPHSSQAHPMGGPGRRKRDRKKEKSEYFLPFSPVAPA